MSSSGAIEQPVAGGLPGVRADDSEADAPQDNGNPPGTGASDADPGAAGVEAEHTGRDAAANPALSGTAAAASSSSSSSAASPTSPRQPDPPPIRDRYKFAVAEAGREAYTAWHEARVASGPPKLKKAWRKQPSKVKLKRSLIREGVPDSHRAGVWGRATGASEMRVPGYYEDAVEEAGRGGGAVEEDVRRIENDVRRTFPQHPLLDTPAVHDQLRRVLGAYAWRNPSIGYCQGLNFLAGMLLYFMPEEDAFWVLAGVIENVLPSQYYTTDMLDLQVDAEHVLGALMQAELPELYEHFAASGLMLSMVTSQWFLTLFVGVAPTATTLRVWDVLFFERDSRFLVRFALAIFRLHAEELLAITNPSRLFMRIREIPPQLYDADALIASVYKDGISVGDISTIRTRTKPEVMAAIRRVQDMRATLRAESAAASSAASSAGATPRRSDDDKGSGASGSGSGVRRFSSAGQDDLRRNSLGGGVSNVSMVDSAVDTEEIDVLSVVSEIDFDGADDVFDADGGGGGGGHGGTREAVAAVWTSSDDDGL